MRYLAILLVALLQVSCDTRSSTSASIGAEIDTVGNVEHVRSFGVAPEWVLTPVMRIGSLEGGPSEFGRIRSVVADREGRVYVADNLSSEVRVFGADGSYISTIGRRGEGPGEFGDLYSLAWLGSELAVMDPRNARIGRFSEEGTWIDEIRYYPITGPGTFIRLHPLGNDGFYAPIPAPGYSRLPFVRISTAGAADTIPAPTAPEGAKTYGLRCDRPDGGIQFINIPEAPATVFSFPPPGGRIAIAWSEGYRIALVDPGGDTIRVIDREHELVPYPDELWRRAMEPYDQMRDQFSGTRCEPAAPERPPYRAALRDILFDDSGRMWIEVATPKGFAWEVFDQTGIVVARANAPDREPTIPAYVRGDHLYQVEVDDMDVQYVGVYRLEPL